MEQTREHLEAKAIAVAAQMRAVPLRDGDFDDPDRYCHPDRLVVWWSEPPVRPRYGAFLQPLGPAPDATTTHVNGIVGTPDSSYAYMGFEAEWDPQLAEWQVYPVTSE